MGTSFGVTKDMPIQERKYESEFVLPAKAGDFRGKPKGVAALASVKAVLLRTLFDD